MRSPVRIDVDDVVAPTPVERTSQPEGVDDVVAVIGVDNAAFDGRRQYVVVPGSNRGLRLHEDADRSHRVVAFEQFANLVVGVDYGSDPVPAGRNVVGEVEVVAGVELEGPPAREPIVVVVHERAFVDDAIVQGDNRILGDTNVEREVRHVSDGNRRAIAVHDIDVEDHAGANQTRTNDRIP